MYAARHCGPARMIVGMDEDPLVTYARTRDLELRGQLAVQHLPLVKFVARKMASNLPDHFEIEDLISWGSLGLLDAIDKFDPSRGHRFSTYAVTRIRGAMLDGLQQMDWAPKQVTSKIRAVRRAREALANELGHDPSAEEIAVSMGCTAAEVRGWLVDDYATRVKTLNEPRGESGPTDLADAGAEEQEIAGQVVELRQKVTQAVCGLGERERAVLLLYYRDDKTLREIAAELGVSVSSATQAHTRLVEQVRDRLAALGA